MHLKLDENFKEIPSVRQALMNLAEKVEQLEKTVIEKTTKPQGWLSSKEAAKYLNIKMNWLDKLCSQGQLDYTQPGGKNRYFKKEDLDDYLKSRVRKSERKLGKEADEILFG